MDFFISAGCAIPILLALIAGYGIIQLIIRMRLRHINMPPGPRGFPLIGSFGLINHLNIWDHKDTYGDISYVRTFGTDFVILNTVKSIRDAFQNPATAEVFAGRPNTFFKQFFVEHDLSFQSIDSEHWKPLRQLFHTLLKTYGGGIEDIENVVGNELKVLIEELTVFAENNQSFNLENHLKASLANILTILISGERFEYSDKKIIATMELTKLGNIYLKPSTDALMLTFPFLRFLPFGPGSLHSPIDKLIKFTLDNLHYRLKSLSQQQLEDRHGIVFELMKKQKRFPWLSSSHIDGLIQNIIGAGTVTTNASLVTFFLLMIYYPDIQENIQQEISDIIGFHRYPSLADRNNMPYTRAVILELTRYSSVAPISLPHMCLKSTEFLGYNVPHGAIIIPNLFRVNHDDSVWDDPWDFKPCRFLDENGKIFEPSHPKRQNLIPFGVGKRQCVGEVFAKTRIFLYITYILQKFTVASAGVVSSKDPRNFQLGLAIQPEEFEVTIMKNEHWLKSSNGPYSAESANNL